MPIVAVSPGRAPMTTPTSDDSRISPIDSGSRNPAIAWPNWMRPSNIASGQPHEEHALEHQRHDRRGRRADHERYEHSTRRGSAGRRVAEQEYVGRDEHRRPEPERQ